MTASLCIRVPSNVKQEVVDIKFFDATDWTPESEKQLATKILDILSTIRSHTQTLEININADVVDVEAVAFLVRKKAKQELTVNNQKLSLREIEVLGLIMQGMTNNEIAEKLFISFETVKSHRKHILSKTNARNTAALISYYHQTFFEK